MGKSTISMAIFKFANSSSSPEGISWVSPYKVVPFPALNGLIINGYNML